jgi:hypothetical protein
MNFLKKLAVGLSFISGVICIIGGTFLALVHILQKFLLVTPEGVAVTMIMLISILPLAYMVGDSVLEIWR